MPIENIGRYKDGDAYKYVCDVDGCSNEYKFVINGDVWNGWQLLEVHEDGKCIETRTLCPKHHIA